MDRVRGPPPVGAAMLPHDTQYGRTIKPFNTEHQAFTLVFAKPNGRILVSPNRAAIPAGRDDEGAVKRDLPGFRVLSSLFHVLLIVCVVALHAAVPAAAQSTSDENKPKDEGKRDEVKEIGRASCRERV